MNRNGMGPRNEGPKTGRGMGSCSSAKDFTISMMNSSVNSNFRIDGSSDKMNAVNDLNDTGGYFIGDKVETGSDLSCWDYWYGYYYPRIIRESYPVYIQEKAKDKGKQAFEILKMLEDKGYLKMEKVKDFIALMDSLIKVL